MSDDTTFSRAVEILDAGLLSSIQDLGRAGVGELGVSPSGAADWLSARAANRLVGNAPAAALIETTMTGLTFKALRPIRIAVTGARAKLTVAGGSRPLWQSMRVGGGSEVSLGPAERGVRSYVAFYGGISVEAVLGSASTDINAGFGGCGRALARADMLKLNEIEEDMSDAERAIPESARPFWRRPATLRVLPGPHARRFAPEDLKRLYAHAYRVSPRTNRQGVRLDGSPLVARNGFDVLSCGVCVGCVQLSSDGLPVVLLSEHQTTGGYAAPFTVITADIPDAAQLAPGDEVRFAPATRVEASTALSEKLKALSEAFREPNPAG